MQRVFDFADFARLTGRSPAEVAGALRGLDLPELLYRPLSDDEQRRVVAEIVDTLEHRPLRVSGSDDPGVWEQGWGEVVDRLAGDSITIDSLKPQYFRGEATCRLEGAFIRPASADFEYYLGLGLRQVLFDEFFADRRRVVELGCGTGINLLLLARRYPGMELIGCDWADASQRILAAMARQTGHAIHGRKFNMLTAQGWPDGAIGADCVVLTVHALEQLGTNWSALIDFLLRQRPGLCVHVEPLLELYDSADRLDDLAARYHLKRGYLRGFLPFVRGLAARQRARIVAERRIRFGGLFHEAYSLLVWRPLGR